MAQTYAQIQEQIARLQSDATALRNSEVADVVSRIKEAIATYDLQPRDLFGGRAGAGTARGSRGAAGSAKYSDGKGGVWGGRGPRPMWLREALSSGRKLEEFAVGATPSKPTPDQAEATPSRARAAKKAGKKKGSKARYSDGTNSWSGFGRKPKWLADAIAGGKKLEDFAS